MGRDLPARPLHAGLVFFRFSPLPFTIFLALSLIFKTTQLTFGFPDNFIAIRDPVSKFCADFTRDLRHRILILLWHCIGADAALLRDRISIAFIFREARALFRWQDSLTISSRPGHGVKAQIFGITQALDRSLSPFSRLFFAFTRCTACENISPAWGSIRMLKPGFSTADIRFEMYP